MGTLGRSIVGEQADEIIELLNQGIAAEINDAYRYLLLSKVASGVHSTPVAAMFAETAQDEWGHVALLMERVVQLGGEPLVSPSEAGQRSYVEYQPPPKEVTDLRQMLTDSLKGERAAISFYRQLFDKTREIDPVTADIARNALIDEIDDEDEMERLLEGWPGQ
jgi:bacterioferritin